MTMKNTENIKSNHPLLILIFGASGDLTKRKLMPALYNIHREGRLKGEYRIMGVSRTSYSDESFREYMRDNLLHFVKDEELDDKVLDDFLSNLYYESMEMGDGATTEYEKLRARLQELAGEGVELDNLLFYLSTPPSLYNQIPVNLKKVKLNTPNSRLIVEKPFGYSLATAQKLNKVINTVFKENQIYRIDHFLGKETAQNMLAMRFANGIFEPLWNRNYIDYVEVSCMEDMGIEGRGGFYDNTGALRDMLQNHLIQLVALTAMEPPAVFNAENFRNEVSKVYNSLIPLTQEDLEEHVVRGQYIENGDKKGYRDEKGVAPDSRAETYVAMKIGIANWRWAGVPFYLRTGKQMPTKVTEVVIHFKPTPHQMFQGNGNVCPSPNKLILRISPNEGTVLKFGMKVPGPGFNIKPVEMDFTYDSLGGLPTSDAYSRLIEDCINGDQTLFTRIDAVEASWRFFDPVLEYWEKNADVPLYGYPAGSWGPKESEEMMREHNAEWSRPSKNLVNSDQYCEL